MLDFFKNADYTIIFATLTFIGVIFFGISVIIKYSVKKKLPKHDKKILKKHFKDIKKSKSYKEKIIYYDKLYHKILKALGYTGTFGEILKHEPNEIGNIQKIWDLHKLRNKLVHEFDNNLDISLEDKAKEYERQIEFILDLK